MTKYVSIRVTKEAKRTLDKLAAEIGQGKILAASQAIESAWLALWNIETYHMSEDTAVSQEATE